MGREDGDRYAGVGVGDAGHNAGMGSLQGIERLVGGDDGGEAGDVAVVHDLVELLLGPRGGGLGTEVIEDEEVGVADALEEFVVGRIAAGGEGGAEVVEEVGDDGEEDGAAGFEGAIGDGCGEVGLAAAVGALEHQPALGVLGEGRSGAEGGFERGAFFRAEAGEAEVEGAELEGGEAFTAHPADLLIGGAGCAAEADGASEGGVGQAGGEAVIEGFGRGRRREDGGQGKVEAVVDDLVELFAGPGRAGRCVEVIEDEQRGVADLLEDAVEGELFVVGVVARAKVVEEVGDDHEEDGVSKGDAVVGEGRGEVGLARTGGAGEHEPAGRVLGEGAGGIDGGGEGGVGAGPALRIEGFEGEAGEGADVGEAGEALAALVFTLLEDTVAGFGAAEAGVVDGIRAADEAGAVADGAGRGVTGFRVGLSGI